MNETFIHLNETHSTNSYLRELIMREKEQPEGTVVITDYQTAGRGQKGNSWESERGKNLTFSILLHPNHIPPGKQFILSQLISIAIVGVLKKYDRHFTIKWPNDIYWKEKKIAGMLIEVDLTGSSLSNAIIGIGININQRHFKSDAPNPVSLTQITGKEHNLSELLEKILDSIVDAYNKYSPDNEEEIRQKYMALLFRNKGVYPYLYGEEIFNASIEGIEPNGQLILKKENGSIHTFAFKEISFVI
ncbi:biotin--[acetyl-CoA-carboxylase] ligase [Coprobacter fastidiosus]|uniref:biotin--[acetyl-CoA-carboxylase] ligase n=1 Tax=Coprobacter fastidiosus TaxID=1099853 RepID=UPI0018A06900|nr:biotin--[acetyl-CoA-carboxylase] ligase [Coprobacter fastidiosus]